MFFGSQKKKNTGVIPPEARRQALACVVVKNPELREDVSGDGEILLLYPVEVKPWFQGIFKAFTSQRDGIITRKLQLDTLGSSVWRKIDNRATVDEIIRSFQSEHQLARREAELSVSSFLKELGRRGLIAMGHGGEPQ